jgi:hypothetical protein
MIIYKYKSITTMYKLIYKMFKETPLIKLLKVPSYEGSASLHCSSHLGLMKYCHTDIYTNPHMISAYNNHI